MASGNQHIESHRSLTVSDRKALQKAKTRARKDLDLYLEIANFLPTGARESLSEQQQFELFGLNYQTHFLAEEWETRLTKKDRAIYREWMQLTQLARRGGRGSRAARNRLISLRPKLLGILGSDFARSDLAKDAGGLRGLYRLARSVKTVLTPVAEAAETGGPGALSGPFVRGFLAALGESDPSRIKRCPICRKFIYAWHPQKITCSERCSSLNRVRRHRDKANEYEANRARKEAQESEKRRSIIRKLREAQSEQSI